MFISSLNCLLLYAYARSLQCGVYLVQVFNLIANSTVTGHWHDCVYWSIPENRPPNNPLVQKLNNGSILFVFNKKVVVKRPRFRSNNKTTITRVKLLKPLSFHLAKHRQKIFCFTSSLHIPKKQFYPDDGRFIIWPNAWSFYNNVSLKTNKMLPLFNFCIKVEPASACLRSFQQTGNLFRYIQLKNIKDLH